uniref:Peptidase S1 domain-containing protein n=1 Tax=Panagrolaimus sp. JU765 TaxID=591449 RepID=A0AC34RJU1_9BILA
MSFSYVTGDDIALIRVSTPMTIPPVPLPANYSHPKNDWLRSAGYGTTKYKIINATHADFTNQATTLMETYLQGADGKDCFNSSYLEKYPDFHVICVGKSDSTLLKGDSVGITSIGVTMPAAFSEAITWSLALQQPFDILSAVTDVSHYCPWIEEVTGGEVKCQTFDPIKIVPKF